MTELIDVLFNKKIWILFVFVFKYDDERRADWLYKLYVCKRHAPKMAEMGLVLRISAPWADGTCTAVKI